MAVTPLTQSLSLPGVTEGTFYLLGISFMSLIRLCINSCSGNVSSSLGFYSTSRPLL